MLKLKTVVKHRVWHIDPWPRNQVPSLANRTNRLLAWCCRLSVCLSICLWQCVLWRSGSVLYTVVFLAGDFLFTSSDTFAVRCTLSFSYKTQPLANKMTDIKSRLQFEAVNKFNTHADHGYSRQRSVLYRTSTSYAVRSAITAAAGLLVLNRQH